MALKPGTRLGPYEILAQLGAGGMGEVYKGRDVRLERLVALKVLAPHLAGNPEARERFEREATTIANLKHAHICLLYDIGKQEIEEREEVAPPSRRPEEPAGGRRYVRVDYLVLEYLEGETLSERLAKGPLPLDQVLQYAIEIADALDKAHRAGVTHRDIKPGNIMIVPSSETASKTETKLLDFGLAKLKQEAVPANLADLPRNEWPTGVGAPTAQGTVLGTAQYMAPEQVEGRVNELDARTDIFSFGATVYEMVTGKKAFEGKSAASVAAKILELDPPPMSSLQPVTPPALDHVVKKCLAKEPDDRWQTARDVWHELKWIAEGGGEGRSLTVAARTGRQWLGWAAAAILLISTAVLGVVHFREAPPEALAARFIVLPPENTSLFAGPQVVMVSPDGTKLAFQANGQLWVRPLDSLASQPLPGTEGSGQHFWSWDSRSLAFYAQGKLKKIDVAGGPPQVLCDATGGANGSWNRDGIILFTTSGGGAAVTRTNAISRVSAAGGSPTDVTTLNIAQGETAHLWPHFLPDGKHFLYLALNSDLAKSAIRVGSLDSTETKFLVNALSFVQYSPPGYLLFQRDGTLLAQPFDAEALELTGDAFPVVEKVQVNTAQGRTAFSVSQNGILAYRTGAGLRTQLSWFDRSGRELGRIGEPGGYISPKLSPDGKQVAIYRTAETVGPGDIWLFDLSRNTETRLTFDPADDSIPIWSPDGSRIVFASRRSGSFGLYLKNSNGTGAEELLLKTASITIPEDWSLDGRYIVYMTTEKDRDVFVLPLRGDPQPAGADAPKPIPFVNTGFSERHGQLSPDGRWMAYVSDESGRAEVYVQSFPAGSGKWQVSTAGGIQPRWRRDGRELFFLAREGNLMAVPIRADATFEAGTPALLFQTPIFGLAISPQFSQQYDVTADGQRFLINVDLTEATAAPITVVLNWQAGIRK